MSLSDKLKIWRTHKPIKISKSKILTLFFKSHNKMKNLLIFLSIKSMIQSQNDYIQSQNNSFNRLEVQMSRLINIVKDRMRKLYLTHIRPFPIALAILMKTKNHGLLETSTKNQFHHTNLNLINFKPWTN